MSEIGEENKFVKKEEAIAGIFTRLDRSICERCDRRIFRECSTVPRVADAEEND